MEPSDRGMIYLSNIMCRLGACFAACVAHITPVRKEVNKMLSYRRETALQGAL